MGARPWARGRDSGVKMPPQWSSPRPQETRGSSGSSKRGPIIVRSAGYSLALVPSLSLKCFHQVTFTLPDPKVHPQGLVFPDSQQHAFLETSIGLWDSPFPGFLQHHQLPFFVPFAGSPPLPTSRTPERGTPAFLCCWLPPGPPTTLTFMALSRPSWLPHSSISLSVKRFPWDV
ncbi:hypothetical protein AAY473_009226 [Plecturocebus cupreus]